MELLVAIAVIVLLLAIAKSVAHCSQLIMEPQSSNGAALANRDTFSLLNVHLDPTDISPALDRLAKRLSKSL